MAGDAATRLRDAALAGVGPYIDILVNFAGSSRPLPLDASQESWEEAITPNFHPAAPDHSRAASADDPALVGPHHQHDW